MHVIPMDTRLYTEHSIGNVQYGIVAICGNGLVTVGTFGVVPLRKIVLFFLLIASCR